MHATVEQVGGKALPCILDVRDEVAVKAAVKSAVDKVNASRQIRIRRNTFEMVLFFCFRMNGSSEGLTYW